MIINNLLDYIYCKSEGRNDILLFTRNCAHVHANTKGEIKIPVGTIFHKKGEIFSPFVSFSIYLTLPLQRHDTTNIIHIYTFITMGVIKYHIVKRKNPQTKEQLYYASKSSIAAPTIDTKTMFAKMAEYGHIPSAHIPAAFNAIVKSIEAFCFNGHSVKFEDLGSFHLTVKSRGASPSVGFSAEDMRKPMIRFTPAAQLRFEMIANTKFQRETIIDLRNEEGE